ncbi:SepM family pheromone-processing serine protease [Bacillaceae bacterium YX66]
MEGVKVNMKVREQRSVKRKLYSVFTFFLIFVLFVLIKLPYYVTYPGDAESLDDMIKIEGGYEDEGDLMLTTIRMGKANVIQYIAAHFNKYQFIFSEKQIRRDWESDRDYDHRQLKIMESSQQMATLVAFQLANEQVEVKNEGVIVAGFIENMPAAKQMKVGDVITQADGNIITEAEQLVDYLKEKKEGDTVRFEIERDGKSLSIDVSVQQFPDTYSEKGEKQYGIGIVGPVTKKSVATKRDVHFDTHNIGGPSAGLMFTLEIYNQLTTEDLTKGYKIAGTGEIFEDGTVGAIGGIEQKLVAADNAGAEVFFAPVAGGNYEDAKHAAADINTKMEVIPVNTVHEAIDYLQSLQPKR